MIDVKSNPLQDVGPHDSSLQHDLTTWSFSVVPELAVLLVRLKALAELHLVHHWTAQGDAFYGDHQLFDRLYKATAEDMDLVAERAVALGGPENVNVGLIAHQVANVLQTNGNTFSIPSADVLVVASLNAEMLLFKTIETLFVSLESRGVLTRGVKTMIENIADKHEVHAYLLKQRCMSPHTRGTK